LSNCLKSKLILLDSLLQESINLQGNDGIEVKCQSFFCLCIVALLHLPLQEKEETAVTIKYLLVISTFLCNHGIFA